MGKVYTSLIARFKRLDGLRLCEFNAKIYLIKNIVTEKKISYSILINIIIA
jgi:hypothetical protein